MNRKRLTHVARAINNFLSTTEGYRLDYIRLSIGLQSEVISSALKELEEKGYAKKEARIGSDTLWTKIIVSSTAELLFNIMEVGRIYEFKELFRKIAVASLTLVELLNELVENKYVVKTEGGYKRIRESL